MVHYPSPPPELAVRDFLAYCSLCLLQGEAGPPSEKELVSNAVQQAVAPAGTFFASPLV